MSTPEFARPTRIDEALQLLGRGNSTILAGGTDVYPAYVSKPLRERIVDLSAIRELRGITETEAHWRIGATTTWTDVIEATLPPLFDGLKLAAREVGGIQIQNSGTVAGNLCNASPAADGIPPLLALDAQVEIASTAGSRSIALHDFVLSNRRTALAKTELVTAVMVPKPADAARSHFLKLGTRKYLVISIVMVAATIEHRLGRVRSARIAVGACSPVAQRLRDLEADLEGQRVDAALADIPRESHLRPLAPIDDVRASRDYRMQATLTLVRRALERLGTMRGAAR